MKSHYLLKWIGYTVLLYAITVFVSCNHTEKENFSYQIIQKEKDLVEVQTNQYQLALNPTQVGVKVEDAYIKMQFANANFCSPKVKANEVVYEDIYPNTSLRFYEKGEGLAAYDFVLQPKANLNDVCLELNHSSAFIDREGQLVLPLEKGQVKHSKPFSYQEINGQKVVVESNFLLADNCLSFELADYDPDYAVVIDPTISFEPSMAMMMPTDVSAYTIQASCTNGAVDANTAYLQISAATNAVSYAFLWRSRFIYKYIRRYSVIS